MDTCARVNTRTSTAQRLLMVADTVSCVDHAHLDHAHFRHRHRHRHIPELTCGFNNTPCLKKRPIFDLLNNLDILDNFWQKCY